MARIVQTMPINTGKPSILLYLKNECKHEKTIIRIPKDNKLKKTFGIVCTILVASPRLVAADSTFPLNSSYTIKTAKKVINIKKIVKND